MLGLPFLERDPDVRWAALPARALHRVSPVKAAKRTESERRANALADDLLALDLKREPALHRSAQTVDRFVPLEEANVFALFEHRGAEDGIEEDEGWIPRVDKLVRLDVGEEVGADVGGEVVCVVAAAEKGCLSVRRRKVDTGRNGLTTNDSSISDQKASEAP